MGSHDVSEVTFSVTLIYRAAPQEAERSGSLPLKHLSVCLTLSMNSPVVSVRLMCVFKASLSHTEITQHLLGGSSHSSGAPGCSKYGRFGQILFCFNPAPPKLMELCQGAPAETLACSEFHDNYTGKNTSVICQAAFDYGMVYIPFRTRRFGWFLHHHYSLLHTA